MAVMESSETSRKKTFQRTIFLWNHGLSVCKFIKTGLWHKYFAWFWWNPSEQLFCQTSMNNNICVLQSVLIRNFSSLIRLRYWICVLLSNRFHTKRNRCYILLLPIISSRFAQTMQHLEKFLAWSVIILTIIKVRLIWYSSLVKGVGQIPAWSNKLQFVTRVYHIILDMAPCKW